MGYDFSVSYDAVRRASNSVREGARSIGQAQVRIQNLRTPRSHDVSLSSLASDTIDEMAAALARAAGRLAELADEVNLACQQYQQNEDVQRLILRPKE